MKLVVMILGLKMGYDLLPVCRKNVFVRAVKPLINLKTRSAITVSTNFARHLHLPTRLCKTPLQVHILAQKAALSSVHGENVSSDFHTAALAPKRNRN